VPQLRRLVADLPPPGLCVIHGGPDGTGTGFTLSTSVFPCH